MVTDVPSLEPSQVRPFGTEQLDLMEDISAHCGEVGLNDLEKVSSNSDHCEINACYFSCCLARGRGHPQLS